MAQKLQVGPCPGRRTIGCNFDLCTNHGNKDWDTFIRKQNAHLGDPDQKEDALQVKQADRLRRMYLFPPAWAENWPDVWSSDELAASRAVRRGGPSMASVHALASDGQPSALVRKLNGSWAIDQSLKAPKDVGAEHRQAEVLCTKADSCRHRVASTPSIGRASELTTDLHDLVTPRHQSGSIKDRTLERATLMNVKSAPEITRRKYRLSDGRPPLDQFFNYATFHKRPIPGKSGTFGSAGWSGTTGLGGRTIANPVPSAARHHPFSGTSTHPAWTKSNRTKWQAASLSFPSS